MTALDRLMGRARRAAEHLMVDRCAVKRITGTTTNPDTGATEDAYTTLYADQSCRLQTSGNWGRQAETGQAVLLIQTAQVQFPISVTGLAVNDLIDVTACAHDPEQVGRRLRVRDLPAKSHASSRRVMVEEVTA